jgi:hypothetical protein
MEILLKSFLIIFCINITIQQIIEIDFIKRKTINRHRSNSKYKNHLLFLENEKEKEEEEELNVLINRKSQIILQIKVGSNQQISNVLVDTGSNILWIAGTSCKICYGIENKFDSSLSSSYKNTTIPMKIEYVTGRTSGFLAYEDFYLGNRLLKNLKFLLSYSSGDETMYSDGILGLGNYYYINPDSLSLIDQLFLQNKIKKKIFTIKLDGENKRGKISIGDIPEEIINNDKNITQKTYGKCRTLRETMKGKPNNYWECKLNQIFFGDNLNKTITIDERINFDSGTNIIVVPYHFMKDYILKDFLAYYLNNKICVIVPHTSFVSILCDLNVDYRTLSNINFRFGEYVLFLKPDELFVNSGIFLQFIISASYYESYNDIWILGEPIFKKMSIVFDKDNQEIGFFGYDVINIGKLPKNNTLKVTIVIATLISIVIIALIYIVMRYLKKQNEKDININMINYSIFNEQTNNNQRI